VFPRFAIDQRVNAQITVCIIELKEHMRFVEFDFVLIVFIMAIGDDKDRGEQQGAYARHQAEVSEFHDFLS
jgi:hypothetical protein